jgi:peptidoglycan/LPS O-acetylase OafA/YrhL
MSDDHGRRRNDAVHAPVLPGPNTSPGARLAGLDGLRGIAVLCVLLLHTGYFLIPSVDAALLPGGFLGVDLFFVLSGFLMTNILLERKQTYTRFYVRRAARIFPALYLLLLADLLYTWATTHGLVGTLRSDVLIASGLGNWGGQLRTTLPYALGQTWSLGVEEQLYLLWPLVLILVCRARPGWIGRLCLVGIVAAFAIKLGMLQAGIPTQHIYVQTEARLDDFLVGALVATVWNRRRAPIRHLPALTCLAGAIFVAGLTQAHDNSRWLYEGGFTLMAACCGILLYACLHRVTVTRFAESRPLRAAGRYSYAIYLWHLLIFLALDHFLPHSTALRTVLALGLVLSASVISTRLVEEPLRRLVAARTRKPTISVAAQETAPAVAFASLPAR